MLLEPSSVRSIKGPASFLLRDRKNIGRDQIESLNSSFAHLVHMMLCMPQHVQARYTV